MSVSDLPRLRIILFRGMLLVCVFAILGTFLLMFGSARIVEDYILEQQLNSVIHESEEFGYWVGSLHDMPLKYRDAVGKLPPGHSELEVEGLEIQVLVEGDRYALVVFDDTEYVPLVGWFLVGCVGAMLISNLLSAIISLRLLQPLEQVVDSLGRDSDFPMERPNTFELEKITAQILSYKKEQEASLRREAGFTRSVSHELRTPLAGMQSTLELLEDTEAPRNIADKISRLQQSTDQLSLSVEALLQLSRSEQRVAHMDGNFREILLNTVTQIPDLGRMDLTVDVIDEAPHQDWALLIVALGILAKNAAAHADAKRVHVSVDRSHAWVADDGIGIKDHDLLSMKRSSKGNLGFSILHRICERCNWELNAKPGIEGAGVSIELVFTRPYQFRSY